MRTLVLYAHPIADSYCAALRACIIAELKKAGHEVDDCDLYAEEFDPVMSRAERANYHDLEVNRQSVKNYVDRLLNAEALIMVYPVWNFGFPAILKGYIDRVFLPGVSFVLEDGKVRTNLDNIRKLTVVTTYGGPRWAAFLAGDPPRKFATRSMRKTIRAGAPVNYLTHYNMNLSTDQSRAKFLEKVSLAMRGF